MADQGYAITRGAARELTRVIARNRQQLPATGQRTRRVWPDDISIQTLPGGDCDCCPGCACYDPTALISACSAYTCVRENYTLSARLPFSEGAGTFAHSSLCVWETASFPVEICGINYGTFRWQLTVSAAWHESYVDLVRQGTDGEDIPLRYESASRFDPDCGTEFIRKPNCTMQEELRHMWPKKVCVKAAGDACPPCTTPTDGKIPTPCCTDPLQTNLQVQFINTGTCAGIDGETIDISFAPSAGYGAYAWVGTGTVCGESVTFVLICTGAGFQWAMSGTNCIDNSLGSLAWSSFIETVCPCAGCPIPTGPFYLLATTGAIGGTISLACTCCDGILADYTFRIVPA